MDKNRIEAFSDGVFAIILTIMVLELKVPQGADLDALRPLSAVLLSYLLSFVFVAIYWVNHHHLFQTVRKVDGRTLWLNLHLLFWLSLLPFATAWLAQSHFASVPVAFYGFLLLAAAVAYTFLTLRLVALHGPEAPLARAVGSDAKGKFSLAVYAIGLGLAFVFPWLAYSLYVLVALIWFVPDTRIENILT
jgi:uncharacterized membrane protein